MAKHQRDPRREALWRERLAQQAASGLSVREFCQRERLTESAFYAWRRTIAERDRQTDSRPQPTFTPAMVTQESPAVGSAKPLEPNRSNRLAKAAPSALAPGEVSIALELSGGCELRLSGASMEQVADLIFALQSRGAP